MIALAPLTEGLILVTFTLVTYVALCIAGVAVIVRIERNAHRRRQADRNAYLARMETHR